ncbi:Npt1/Npt2 family nucleotide transporter [Paenibacillus arenilitoris]|uniref:ADP,ATP carrier protein n=1 Tax=Paenibacillus arenilitoris TaxID=2772299 RepID=A0A927H5I0_9BACL|nr:Npt1/Npt2 family nucleotide transporter [Paenibacillus arenilitoris]MBD2867574.1 cyclic nucleotide-binding domain-containing protein [Paenibacillus arenilitoris]
MLRAVGARPEDQRKLLLMAPVFFICGIAEMLNYNGFMTLFNQRFGSEYLPYVYAAEAIILPLEAWLLSWLSAKLPKPRLMRVLYALLLGIVVANALILLGLQSFGIELRWYYPVLFVASNFVVRQQTILLWSLAIDLCPTQQAKRLMPVFVGSATLGGVAAGLLAQLISLAFGPAVVYAAGGALLLIAWGNYRKVIARYLVPMSLKLEESAAEEEQVSTAAVFGHALRSPFLLTVILLMTLMPALYFLMEYEFLNVTKTSFPDEQSFSRFFGMITMVLFVLAFLLQTVSGKLMARLGASQMLTAIAGVYVVSFAGAVLFVGGAAALPVISIGYMLLYLLLYYSAEPSYQLFFKTLPLAQRDSYRYAAQGIAASAGILIGAGLQFLHSGFGLSWTLLSVVGLAGAAVLLVLAWLGRRYYMRELVGSVQASGAFDLAEQFDEIGRNEAAMAEIRRMLKHPLDSAREIALQIVGRLQNPQDVPELLALIDDPKPRIRVAAVRAMNLEKADLQALVKVAAFLEDPDDEMRAEGVRQIARMKHMEHQAFYFLRQKLLDRHPSVVAEAVKAMYSFDHAPSREACAEAIDRILDEGGESSVHICRVVAELKLTAFVPKVEKLVDEAHAAARVAATACLGRLGHAAIVPKLLRRLPTMDQEMLRTATESFIQIGEGAIAPLTDHLEEAPPKSWTSIVTALSALLPEERARTVLAESALRRLQALDAASAYSGSLSRLGHEELSKLAMLRWREVRDFVFDGAWSILARLADEQVADSVKRAAADDDEEIRGNAWEVLAEGMGERRLSQQLLAALERGEERKPAGDDEEARSSLRLALQGSDDWWREIAAAALTEEDESVSNEQQMMSRLNKVVFLRQVPYFADLSLEELGLIAGIAEERVCLDGEPLLKRGEPHQAMYVIIEGNVELTSVSAAGWEGTIGVLGSGEVCGVTSALDGTASTVTAQSLLGDVKVLKLVGENVSRLIRLYPEIGIGLLRASFARIRLLEEMMMRIDS